MARVRPGSHSGNFARMLALRSFRLPCRFFASTKARINTQSGGAIQVMPASFSPCAAFSNCGHYTGRAAAMNIIYLQKFRGRRFRTDKSIRVPPSGASSAAIVPRQLPPPITLQHLKPARQAKTTSLTKILPKLYCFFMIRRLLSLLFSPLT